MTLARIKQLAQLLPTTLLHRPHSRVADSMDPRFGHRLVGEFVRAELPLPPAVTEMPLRRAHTHYSRQNQIADTAMQEIDELIGASCNPQRYALQALLMCSDTTCQQIAAWLSIDCEVVELFQELHFNVSDRRNEPYYLASIAFPNGQAGLSDGKSKRYFEEHILLQAGLQRGSKEVLWRLGIGNPDGVQPSLADYTKNLKSRLVQSADEILRGGNLDATNLAVVKIAKDLVTSTPNASLAGREATDREAGLGALDMGPGDAILYTQNGITDTSIYDNMKKAHDLSLQKAIEKQKGVTIPK